MPKRVRAHQIETKSRVAFEALLPDPWLYRRKDADDYGIDGEVEVFDEGGHSTGLHFLVQLKATDETEEGKALARSVPLDHAHYYRSLALPVLMVRYLVSEDAVYTRWFHSHDSYGAKPDAQSLTFRWATTDRWAASRPAELVAEAEAFFELRSATLRLPMPFHLDLEVDPAWDMSSAAISIGLRAEAARRRDVFAIVPGDPDPGTGRLIVRPDRLAVELARVTAATLHIDESYDIGARAAQLSRDVLALAALAFEHIGQADISGRVAVTYLPSSWVVTQTDAVAALSASMTRARQVRDALDLAEVLDQADDDASRDASVLFTFPAQLHSGSLAPDELEHFRRTARNRIARREKRGDQSELATEYHNLANHYRNRAEPQEALDLFDLAVQADPEYARRAHYWQERAGVLFGLHDYEASAEAYYEALKLGASDWFKALYADALLFAGQYADALEAFEDYNAAHANAGRGLEWNLKELVARQIVDGLEIRSQQRNPLAAQEILNRLAQNADGFSAADREPLYEVLELDALNAAAWMSLGLMDTAHGGHGAGEFLAGALLHEGDPHAWAFAFMSAYWSGTSDEIQTQIVATGQRMTSGEMAAALIDLVQIQGPDFPSDDFLAALDRKLAELPDENEGDLELRMLEADGHVESVQVPTATRFPSEGT